MMGHATVVTQLLRKKANQSIQDIDGFTAMHHGARRGHTPVLRTLLIHLAATQGKINVKTKTVELLSTCR